MTRPTAGAVHRWGVRAWLAGVTLLAALPMLVVLVLAMWWQAREQHDEALARLQRQASQAARVVTDLIAVRKTTLRTLALGPVAISGDVPSLHGHALRVDLADPLIQSISLADAAGRLEFDTRIPLGEHLPANLLDRGVESPVFEQGRAVVSPILTDPGEAGPSIGLAVPVSTEQGVVRWSLRALVRAEDVSRALTQLTIPHDWTVVVIDQQSTIVARNTDARPFVGASATDSLQAFVRAGGHGVSEVLSRTGERLMVAASDVSGTGWTAVIGLPVDSLLDERRSLLSITLLAGLGVAALGSLLSFALGHRLAGQIIAVARGERTELDLREIGRIHERLDAAARDALTGLPGRADFLERASSLLPGPSSDAALALMFIDLDHFKQLNDSRGHEAGDRALVAVAQLLQQAVRTGDLAARIGGDEFIVAMTAARSGAAESAMRLAQRIRDGVIGLDVGLGCSIGLAVSLPGESLDTLMSRADRAMYEAKRAGRNRLVSAH